MSGRGRFSLSLHQGGGEEQDRDGVGLVGQDQLGSCKAQVGQVRGTASDAWTQDSLGALVPSC